jgi:hypothetical protein
VFYPRESYNSGRQAEVQAEDSDDEISEMKSLVAALRQECEDLKKRQKIHR